MRTILIVGALLLVGPDATAAPAASDAGWSQLVAQWQATDAFEATVAFDHRNWDGSDLRGEVYYHLYADLNSAEVVALKWYGTKPRATRLRPDRAATIYTEEREPEDLPFNTSGLAVVMGVISSGLAACSTSAVLPNAIPLAVRDAQRYHWRMVLCPGQRLPTYVAYGFQPEDVERRTPVLDRIAWPNADRRYAILDFRGVVRNGPRPEWLGNETLVSKHLPIGALPLMSDPLASTESRAWSTRFSLYRQGVVPVEEVGVRPSETLSYTR
jgi:hypothetical protein